MTIAKSIGCLLLKNDTKSIIVEKLAKHLQQQSAQMDGKIGNENAPSINILATPKRFDNSSAKKRRATPTSALILDTSLQSGYNTRARGTKSPLPDLLKPSAKKQKIMTNSALKMANGNAREKLETPQAIHNMNESEKLDTPMVPQVDDRAHPDSIFSAEISPIISSTAQPNSTPQTSFNNRQKNDAFSAANSNLVPSSFQINPLSTSDDGNLFDAIGDRDSSPLGSFDVPEEREDYDTDLVKYYPESETSTKGNTEVEDVASQKTPVAPLENILSSISNPVFRSPIKNASPITNAPGSNSINSLPESNPLHELPTGQTESLASLQKDSPNFPSTPDVAALAVKKISGHLLALASLHNPSIPTAPQRTDSEQSHLERLSLREYNLLMKVLEHCKPLNARNTPSPALSQERASENQLTRNSVEEILQSSKSNESSLQTTAQIATLYRTKPSQTSALTSIGPTPSPTPNLVAPQHDTTMEIESNKQSSYSSYFSEVKTNDSIELNTPLKASLPTDSIPLEAMLSSSMNSKSAKKTPFRSSLPGNYGSSVTKLLDTRPSFQYRPTQLAPPLDLDDASGLWSSSTLITKKRPLDSTEILSR